MGVPDTPDPDGAEPREVLGALRWESCNPWARAQELLSSHPIVVHRRR